MRRGIYLWGSLLLALSLVLSACGGDGTSSNDSGSAQNGSKSGGTLIYGRGSDSLSLDPINVTDGESIRVTQNVFDTLFTYDKNLKLKPDLATGYKVDGSGRTYTINLRKNVKFQDGTDFDAKSVVFNWNRWSDPKNPYHNGDFPYYSFLYGGFRGDKNHLVESVKATGKYTVQIKLKKKTAAFISYLSVSMFGIASPSAVKKYGKDFKEHPVGTGPFQFVSWKRNDTITLRKNKYYWEKGKPYLNKLIFKVIPDNSARLSALRSGEIDLMDGLNPSDADSVKSNQQLQLIKRPSFNMSYIAMNTQKKPFNDPKVRQAVNMAIDKPAIVKAFYSGMAVPAKNPVPPTLWGYNDSVKDYGYHIKQAKKLLAEAGYPKGFHTTLWTMSNPRPYLPEPQKIAEAIQADLAKIGIKINVKSYEWSTYLDKTTAGEHTMALYGWTGVMADPDNFLYPNLSGTETKKPASNIAFYQNKEVTHLLEQARVTLNQHKRIELYKQAQSIIHKDAPWVLLAHTTQPIAMSAKVKGFEPHPMETDALEKVYLDQ
ncbi:MAG: ABC transporter substrate-binding protein [Sporolactobacillus sp.]|jgi:peptide/nickel transport system substrate-binding protein|nr:ABC transporter substrate-binding protein [Sporolactobacillus sp.]